MEKPEQKAIELMNLFYECLNGVEIPSKKEYVRKCAIAHVDEIVKGRSLLNTYPFFWRQVKEKLISL